MDKAIEAVDLVRDFGRFCAVDQVTFSVEKGEIFGFLGPNGAGKTTTVRMLTTLLKPTAGSVHIGGVDALRHPYQARLQIGLVPEESNVYTELSAWDNLIFSGRLYRVPGERESRATELLRAFELWEKRDVKVQGFSKGMRRRLTIAMALIHQPAILFMDEPTSGLDVRSACAIKDVVGQLHADGTTVFLTTHQIEDANQLCDRVAIMNRGRIAAIDSPERLKQTAESVQAVEVAFDRGGGPHQESVLRRLPGVTDVARFGDKWRLYTPDPSALMPLLFDFAGQRESRILTLNSLGPSLEDVFLRLTGQKVGEPKEPGNGEQAGPSRRGMGGMRGG